MKIEKERILANISKKGKVSLDQLNKEYDELMTSMPPSDNKEVRVMKELNDKYVKTGNTLDFEVVIFGLGRKTDFNADKIKKAMNDYANNAEGTLESGRVKLVNGSPVVIDLQEKFKNASFKNPNFGKQLLPSYNRNCLCLARKADSDEWIQTTIALRNQFADSKLPSVNTVYNFTGIGSIEKGLKTSKNSKFNESTSVVNMKDVIETLCKDKIFMLGDLMEHTQSISKSDEGYYDRFVITSGEVKFMTENTGKSHNGAIDDLTSDQLVTIFVEEALPVPETNVEYTFIAQSSIGKGYDQETKQQTDEEKLVLNILGYY